jgi:hypothetical protein
VYSGEVARRVKGGIHEIEAVLRVCSTRGEVWVLISDKVSHYELNRVVIVSRVGWMNEQLLVIFVSVNVFSTVVSFHEGSLLRS